MFFNLVTVLVSTFELYRCISVTNRHYCIFFNNSLRMVKKRLNRFTTCLYILLCNYSAVVLVYMVTMLSMLNIVSGTLFITNVFFQFYFYVDLCHEVYNSKRAAV